MSCPDPITERIMRHFARVTLTSEASRWPLSSTAIPSTHGRNRVLLLKCCPLTNLTATYVDDMACPVMDYNATEMVIDKFLYGMGNQELTVKWLPMGTIYSEWPLCWGLSTKER